MMDNNLKHLEEMEELRERLDLARAQEDLAVQAETLYRIGRIYRGEEVLEAAWEHLSECADICRQASQNEGLAAALVELAALDLTAGRAREAQGRLEEALELFTGAASVKGQALCLDKLAELQVADRDFVAAADSYQEALGICLDHDDKVGAIYFSECLIPLKKALAQVDGVIKLYRGLISLAEKMGDRRRMAIGLVGLSDAYERTGRAEEGVPPLMLAHDLFMRLDAKDEARKVREHLAEMGVRPG